MYRQKTSANAVIIGESAIYHKITCFAINFMVKRKNEHGTYILEVSLNEQEETIDLRVLLKVLTEHIIPIIIVTILAAGIGFSLAYFVIPKHYTSEALMYVENSSSKQEDSAININDITAAQKLVNTCQILFTSDYVFSELNSFFDDEYTKEELEKMIKIESVNSTEVLKISVETESPQESYNVANELITLSIGEFQRIIKNGSIETVSAPTYPDKHNFPSATQFTIIGALIGMAVTYFIYLIKEMLDTKLKPGDDIAQMYDLPVFAEILDFETAGKSGYKYSKYGGYGKYGYYYSSESRDDAKLRREEKQYSEEYEAELDALEAEKAAKEREEQEAKKDKHDVEEKEVSEKDGKKERQTANK